jgi:hypothetical protein
MPSITISGSSISGFAAGMGGSIQQYGAISTGSGLPSITGRFSHIMPGNANGRFVIQSGYALATSPAQNGNFVAFPVSFPTACVAIVMSETGADGWGQQYTCYAPNSFYSGGFTFSAVFANSTGAYYAGNAGASYIAIGY